MADILIQRANAYASQFQLQLAERLGFGIHGIIFAAKGKSEKGKTAVKVHKAVEPYRREVAVYQRLREAGVRRILGFHVPTLVRHEDDLLVIEMDIVTRPFILDFAGAYLDYPPQFPDEMWTQWEVEKIEQFGNHWSKVKQLLATLEELDIYMLDVSPSNIAFE
jgi:hypothetical protein